MRGFTDASSLRPPTDDPSDAPLQRIHGASRVGAACLAMLAMLAITTPGLGCRGDIEARMAEVRALQDVGQFTASIEELREILSISPGLPEATYRLGVALVQTGEPSRAIWALEKAAEHEEYTVPAGMLLASAHFSVQNYEAVVRAADRVLEIDPERIPALHMRAQGNLGATDLEAAMEDTERLIELSPNDYRVRVLHATLLGDMKRTEEATAAHDLVKEIGLEGGDPAVAHRACIFPAVYARDYLHDVERANALYDDCTTRFPTNAYVLSEAMKFFDAHDQEEKSTQLIRGAVEAAPENLSLRATLSNRLAKQGDAEAAEEVLVEAVESFRSAGSWNLLANFYRARGDAEKALEAIEKVSELSGGGGDRLRFAQADLLIDLGEIDRAEEIARSLDEPTYAKLLRGRVLLVKGNAAGALELFEQGTRAWPNNAGARYLAGVAALQLGDFERAASELRESIRVDAQATEASRVLARLHYQRGRYADAVRFARMAVRRRGSDLSQVYTVAARSFTKLEQYENARTAIAALGRLPDRKAASVVELAELERHISGPAAAIRAIDKSGLDLTDPSNAAVLRQLTEQLFAADRGSDALTRADAAIAKHPDSAEFQTLRGSTLLRLERTADARTAFERAVELDPENGTAYAGLATVVANEGDRKRAVELFDKAAELDTEQDEFRYAAAQLARDAGGTEEAERRLRDLVRRSPGHVGARNDLAWMLAEKGEDLDLALALAQEARRLDRSPDVLDTLGWVRFKRGEMSAAVVALEQAVEAGADASMRYRLGIALSKAGDDERAREMLQAAIDAGAFPEVEQARRELARLEQL
jgi:tetratricopeptide (TPR) repeat protein